MTTTSTPAKRPVVGLLFALGGLLATLSFIFSEANISVGGVWFGRITDIALTLGFLLLTLGRGAGALPRLFFAIATVGWAIIAIESFVGLGELLKVGVILALVGSLISGILVLVRGIFSRVADVLFLLATILIAVVLLNVLFPFLAGILATIVIALYAVLLLLAGIFIIVRR